MTVRMQKRIIRTTGVSLTTMLLLVLAQALIQVTLFFDLSQMLILLGILFPFIALVCGMICQLLADSLWSTVIAAATAFGIVLVVLFSASSLAYVPLYVLVSLAGYWIASRIIKRRKTS